MEVCSKKVKDSSIVFVTNTLLSIIIKLWHNLRVHSHIRSDFLFSHTSYFVCSHSHINKTRSRVIKVTAQDQVCLCELKLLKLSLATFSWILFELRFTQDSYKNAQTTCKLSHTLHRVNLEQHWAASHMWISHEYNTISFHHCCWLVVT